MSQDIISDALSKIMNGKRAKKKYVEINIKSKLLISILELAKEEGFIETFEVEGRKVKIKIGDLNECKAIKPRYFVDKENIERFIRRYLPARDYGMILVTTNKGLMKHTEAIEKNIGGALVAYFY
ncbi:30S ribosomal protein S8 [Candidatus Pacearchaeota archaeon CG10_big_fil_rev_8_21_14_0_10_35_13]|nr:MAG: 30S ribosomal protein S8 [Candidatus Pacearchaeota archaeon CG10_big_fil_rev_8_21_14_0_10_35_13]